MCNEQQTRRDNSGRTQGFGVKGSREEDKHSGVDRGWAGNKKSGRVEVCKSLPLPLEWFMSRMWPKFCNGGHLTAHPSNVYFTGAICLCDCRGESIYCSSKYWLILTSSGNKFEQRHFWENTKLVMVNLWQVSSCSTCLLTAGFLDLCSCSVYRNPGNIQGHNTIHT